MILPHTHSAALLLLTATLVCLGIWPNLFRAVSGRWRFELFAYDFAFGALALSLTAAWTLGTLGSDLSFSDRILVAGLRSQAIAGAGGFIFGIGNLLLLAALALSGMAVAFPLIFAIALMVWSAASGLSRVHWISFGAGALLLLLTVIFAASMGDVKPASQPGKKKGPSLMSRNTKGVIAGIVGGLLIGVALPVAESGFWGDLGLGAYAGTMLFSAGLVCATLIFGLFFLNIAIDGPGLTLRSYFQGKFGLHLSGLAAGAVWALGLLAWLLAQSTPAVNAPTPMQVRLFFEAAAILAMLCGLFWREVRKFPLWLATLVCYAAGITAMALARG